MFNIDQKSILIKMRPGYGRNAGMLPKVIGSFLVFLHMCMLLKLVYLTHARIINGACGILPSAINFGMEDHFSANFWFSNTSGLIFSVSLPLNSDYQNICMAPADKGNCYKRITRHFYNNSSLVCETFTYSGCGGNQNNFRNKKQCKRTCRKGRNCNVCSCLT